MTRSRNVKDPDEERLRGLSRYGELDGGCVEVVSRPGGLRRIAISYGPHRVWLQEREAGAIQLETGRESYQRESTGSRDWTHAFAKADEALQRLVIEDQLDRTVATAVHEVSTSGTAATLEAIEDAFVTARYSDRTDRSISDSHLRNVARVLSILRLKKGAGWRPAKEIAADPKGFVDWYIRLRTTNRITFPQSWSRRPCGPLSRRKTAIAELKDFSGVLSEVGNLVPENPLAGYRYRHHADPGDEGAVIHRPEAPEKALTILIRSPVHPESGIPLLDGNGEPLLPPAHRTAATDGGARLRIMLSTVGLTGHRPSNYWGTRRGGRSSYPRVQDLVLEPDALRAALVAAPNQRPAWADHFVHGAMVSNRNKSSFHRLTPFGRVLNYEVRRWMTHHPEPDNPNAPLIPAIENSGRPVSETMLRKWMAQAIAVAHQDAEAMGLPPEHYLPSMAGGSFGGFRPLWRSVMGRLGWDIQPGSQDRGAVPSPVQHLLFYGGWSLGGADVQARVYNRLDPEILMGVANMEPAAEVYARIVQRTGNPMAGLLEEVEEG